MTHRFPRSFPLDLSRLGLHRGFGDVQGGVTSEGLRRHLEKEAILKAAQTLETVLQDKRERLTDPPKAK